MNNYFLQYYFGISINLINWKVTNVVILKLSIARNAMKYVDDYFKSSVKIHCSINSVSLGE